MGQAPAVPPTTDVLGAHDLGSGLGGVRGQNSNACIYCHAPHNGSSVVPLWNQTLSNSKYNLYSDPTTKTYVNQPSQLCLSCHDGEVAVGQSMAFGSMGVTGTVNSIGGLQLSSSHPFSIQPQLNDAANLVSTVYASHTTKDPNVKLIGNNVECSTCHDVHNQYRDRRSLKFLVIDNANGALCKACHETVQRNVGGVENTLALWDASAHAQEITNQITPQAQLGNYTTVGQSACSSCHAQHNGVTRALLAQNPNRPTDVDDTAQACFRCHDGSKNLSDPILNVLADYQKTGPNGVIRHPMTDPNNQHKIYEETVLDRNRHATCSDCHSPHGAQKTTNFPATPNVRPSQLGVPGVNMAGAVVAQATYQYEICLRCHGTSVGKTTPANLGYMPARSIATGDPLDISLEFAHASRSSHAVMRVETNLVRPSLLTQVLDLNLKPSRPMPAQMLCTDCHNSDSNREYGMQGANGPHGSLYEHILERNYFMTQASSGAGSDVTIQMKQPSSAADLTGPYALCAKCHNLQNIMSGTDYAEHKRHVYDEGFSCSVCHSAHGVPQAANGTLGRNLVSFDVNVVTGPGGSGTPTWDGATCSLRCHSHDHVSSISK